ncbi:MAG: hypothetical protein V2I25_07570 [Woeseiaceae bacterium]|jgi:hypothetical protein|nr:hypothetical protein [Woeseiaceae bacterium]
MQDLLTETRNQLGALDRLAAAMIDLRLVRWLLLLAVVTSLGWATGSLVLLLDMLPEWALMPVAMPLFGSMIAVYSVVGLGALSLFLSVGLDVVSAPFRGDSAERVR